MTPFMKPIRAFMRWWGEGLLKNLPISLRRMVRTQLPRLVLEMHETNAFSAYWKQDGKYQPLGEYSLNDDDIDLFSAPPKRLTKTQHLVEVQLDPQQGLSLDQRFPDAIQENLTQVVGFQLDRLTPFSTDRAYYSAKQLKHHKKSKEIDVNVQVIPKQHADRVIDRLRKVGAPDINLVSVAGGDPSIPIGTTTQEDLEQCWSWIPLGFMVLALIAALALPTAYKYYRLQSLQTSVAELRKNSSSQLEIRDRLMAAEEALTFLSDRRISSPVALDVIERLSGELPKHTWLDRLQLKGNELYIRGESKQALTLIDQLENSRQLSAVKFVSPVTRNSKTGSDKFQIQAIVEGQSHE